MLAERAYREALSDAVATGAQDHANACSYDAGEDVTPDDLRGGIADEQYRDLYPDATDEQLDSIVNAWSHAWVGAHAASCVPCGCD